METETTLLTAVYYYIREKYYGTAHLQADQGCRKFGENEEFICLREYCNAKLGKSAEAIRQLTALKKNSSIGLGVLMTLRVAYMNETSVDRESIKDIDSEINAQWGNAPLEAAYVAGLMLFFEGSMDRARSLLDRYINANSREAKVLSLRSWLDVVTSRDIKTSQQYFEEAIESEKWPDAYLGLAEIYKERHNSQRLNEILNSLLDDYSTHIPAYIESIKAAIMVKDWDKVTTIAQNASLIQGSDCIPIQLCECGYAILIQGDSVNIEQLLSELYESTSKVEHRNSHIHYKIASFLSTVCFDNNTIKQYSHKFLDTALSFSKQVDYIAKKSYLLLQDNDVRGALQMAKTAVEQNVDTDPNIIYSVIRCYLAAGDIKDARGQLEFITEAHSDVEKSVAYYYFNALLVRAEGGSNDVFASNIHNAIDAHFSILQRNPYGLEYVEQLDPAFLVEVISRLYEIAPITPSKVPDNVLKEVDRIASAIYDNCPGLGRSCYFLAKAKYLQMDNSEAERLLKICMGKGSAVAEAYLLMSQLFMQRHQLTEASKCLDAGLAFSFQVREHPLYFLTKARMLKHEKGRDTAEAIQMLQTALDLPAFKEVRVARSMDINEADRIAIYLEMIDCYQLAGRIHEADQTMREALNKYTGSQEEDKLVLMNAQLRLQRGDIKGALEVLQGVGPDQPNFQAARMKMAEIYLTEAHDKQKFASCYRDILNADPSPHAYVLLGDAYMSIQEPNKAIEAYETAMRRNPKDHALAEKIGNAYVNCHLYHKAITFYETAMKTGKQNMMRLRYAEELLRIKNYDKCERILNEVCRSGSDAQDAQSIRDHVNYWMLLSKLHYDKRQLTEAISALSEARDLQARMLSKSLSEQGNAQNEKKLAKNICVRLAELYREAKQDVKAVEYYKKAIEYDNKDVKTHLALANLLYATGKIVPASHHCQLILSLDRNNNEATLLMADIYFQKSEGDMAMKHFSQLLERNPNQYHAMARCIELLWRKGDLEAAEGLLKKALENNPRSTIDAGYNYCKGLLEWYTCDPNSALNYFNRARRDVEWGEKAVYNIIEIFLNPDYETLGGEALENDRDMSDPKMTERELNVKLAERFLNEFRSIKQMENKFRLMESFILLASSDKNKIQQALNNFNEFNVAVSDQDVRPDVRLNVGAILGSARAYLLLKQSQKAKAQLKRLIGYAWTLEDADYLERAWLLLADIYLSQTKNEQATAVLRTVLSHNSSSIKAFEYMGLLHERQQEFSSAAANYECSWRLGKNRNPSVGFKLAYNYLKCRKYFECIEVCLQILLLYPDYPKIRQEILDKARMALFT